jgi:hypothetical protein
MTTAGARLGLIVRLCDTGVTVLFPFAGMAELADAADSKSAGPRALGGSIPPPGTSRTLAHPRPVPPTDSR